ncbi:aspartate/glutamate racemase family protein [Arthrobacter sp. GCM10027362]|uniref:maleate cis-trans isomerase family protein n=1 Tax=Arthrobacter sp. GCM10027362 TaxID=3273379 RepID=UPI003633B053
MGAPGPSSRLGILVPSSNSNAESMTAAMLAGHPHIGVHYSRFRLPPSLDDAIDVNVLGNAPSLLGDAEVDAVAFHGTSGSWTGLAGDHALCAALTAATGAPSTTASLAVLAALQALPAARVAVVFPGPADIVPLIRGEYARNGIDVVHTSVPTTVMSNPQIGRLSRRDIDAMMRPAFANGADAVVCIGTNLRSGYLAADFEAEFGVPVVDSAAATLWHLLRLADAAGPIPGWGRLLAMS